MSLGNLIKKVFGYATEDVRIITLGLDAAGMVVCVFGGAWWWVYSVVVMWCLAIVKRPFGTEVIRAF